MTTRLTPEQIAEIKSEMIASGPPVRFQVAGQTVDICTGQLQPRGINVIHQIHYWRFTKDTTLKIARWLGASPVFSESGELR